MEPIKRSVFIASSKVEEPEHKLERPGHKRARFTIIMFLSVHLFGKLLEVLLIAMRNAVFRRGASCRVIDRLLFIVTSLWPNRVLRYDPALIQLGLHLCLGMNLCLIRLFNHISKIIF